MTIQFRSGSIDLTINKTIATGYPAVFGRFKRTNSENRNFADFDSAANSCNFGNTACNFDCVVSAELLNSECAAGVFGDVDNI